MSQAIKAFMGVFFLLMLLLLGVGILSAQMDVSDALNYKSDMIAEIENSNYSPAVLNACIRQATDNGYTVEIKTYAPQKGTVTYTEPNVKDTTDVVMAEIILTYPYRIGILDSVTNHQVRGFAR